MSTQAVVPETARRRKKLVRRSAPDQSQGLRRIVQFAFVGLNLWIGAQFWLWVRYFEHGSQQFASPAWHVPRPLASKAGSPSPAS